MTETPSPPESERPQRVRTMAASISTRLVRGPLLLDAAMGTRLIARGLDLDHDDPALWNLTHPEVVAEIHRRDLAAGADAVLTNTFGANRVWLSRFGRTAVDQVAAINRAAVALARQAAGPSRFVIGCLGPSAGTEADAYREQTRALAEAGVDALLFETHTVATAEVALRAVSGLDDGRPRWVSLVDWPEPVDVAVRRLIDAGASVLGANCRVGMEPMRTIVPRLHAVANLPLLVKPSAGLAGQQPESPDAFALAVPELLDQGVRLFGGCCGTTEAHLQALRSALP